MSILPSLPSPALCVLAPLPGASLPPWTCAYMARSLACVGGRSWESLPSCPRARRGPPSRAGALPQRLPSEQATAEEAKCGRIIFSPGTGPVRALEPFQQRGWEL